jgi:hypothetical protein
MCSIEVNARPSVGQAPHGHADPVDGRAARPAARRSVRPGRARGPGPACRDRRRHPARPLPAVPVPRRPCTAPPRSPHRPPVPDASAPPGGGGAGAVIAHARTPEPVPAWTRHAGAWVPPTSSRIRLPPIGRTSPPPCVGTVAGPGGGGRAGIARVRRSPWVRESVGAPAADRSASRRPVGRRPGHGSLSRATRCPTGRPTWWPGRSGGRPGAGSGGRNLLAVDTGPARGGVRTGGSRTRDRGRRG